MSFSDGSLDTTGGFDEDEVRELLEPEDIFPAYQHALERSDIDQPRWIARRPPAEPRRVVSRRVIAQPRQLASGQEKEPQRLAVRP